MNDFCKHTNELRVFKFNICLFYIYYYFIFNCTQQKKLGVVNKFVIEKQDIDRHITLFYRYMMKYCNSKLLIRSTETFLGSYLLELDDGEKRKIEQIGKS